VVKNSKLLLFSCLTFHYHCKQLGTRSPPFFSTEVTELENSSEQVQVVLHPQSGASEQQQQ